MKLKLDEQGHAVIQDGMPVFTHADGKDIPFNVPAAVSAIDRLNGEAKGYRKQFETLEAKAKAFDGLDPEAARKAVETVANLNDKKLIDAGEVEKVKEATAKAFEDKLKAVDERYKPIVQERDTLAQKLVQQTLGAAFAGSPFIRDKIAIPPDAVQAIFGPSFRVENDKVVAYRGEEKVFSRERPGEVAGFDEAIGLLIEGYHGRDTLLKGSGASGSGARGSGGAGGGKTMARTAFTTMSPADQMAYMKGGGTLTD